MKPSPYLMHYMEFTMEHPGKIYAKESQAKTINEWIAFSEGTYGAPSNREDVYYLIVGVDIAQSERMGELYLEVKRVKVKLTNSFYQKVYETISTFGLSSLEIIDMTEKQIVDDLIQSDKKRRKKQKSFLNTFREEEKHFTKVGVKNARAKFDSKIKNYGKRF